MATEEQVTQLADELEALRVVMKDQTAKIRQQDELIKKHGEVQDIDRPIVMMTSRRVERFRDRPSKATDQTIYEWVSDIRTQAETRKLSKLEFAALLMDHLGGKARQEVLGRGEAISKDSEQIIRVLVTVFGDGDTLPMLQQRFYGYRQGADEDLLTCSLRLVEIYQRIAEIDPSFTACREASLKGRLAECVRDEGLQRELRRLNIELESLSFFDIRDRAIHWLGKTKQVAPRATSNETQAECLPPAIDAALKRQEALIAQQQKQIESLLGGFQKPAYRPRNPAEPRKCWGCGSTSHLKRDCVKDRAPGQPEQLNE